MIEHSGPVDWSKVKIPEGRTLNAARWQYQDYKRQFSRQRKTSKTVTNKSPTKSSARKMKRKRIPKAMEDFIDDDEDPVDAGEGEKPSKVTKRIKEEVDNADTYGEAGSDTSQDKRDYLFGAEEELEV